MMSMPTKTELIKFGEVVIQWGEYAILYGVIAILSIFLLIVVASKFDSGKKLILEVLRYWDIKNEYFPYTIHHTSLK